MLSIYSGASQVFQISQEMVICVQGEPVGRKTLRGPLPKSQGVSQGKRAREGPRVPRGQEPPTWHLVDSGGSREFQEARMTLGFLAGLPGKLAQLLF